MRGQSDGRPIRRTLEMDRALVNDGDDVALIVKDGRVLSGGIELSSCMLV